MGRTPLFALVLAATGVLPAAGAWADTRAGVEAWTRGDHAAAVREWTAAAARGDADALFNLGQAYKLGRGVAPDLARAEELFGQAAARGHLQAADNYGLLLFQRGEKARALPYLRAAAERGDPRAQYLLGLAHFNGDLVARDWPRGYALVSLARQQGLEAARPALQEMDRYIPLDQRQQGVALAGELQARADATRAQQLAAVELGAAPLASSPAPARSLPPAPRLVMPQPAEDDSPATAGADYARPLNPAPNPAPRRAAATAAPDGRWSVQLGAFAQPGNADALWQRARGRAELAGHPRRDLRSGRVTRLLATGFASASAAQAACARLKASGIPCLVVTD